MGNGRLYSISVTNMLDFVGDDTLRVAFLPCKEDGSGHADVSPQTFGSIKTTNSSETFTNLTWGVPNTVVGGWCVQNLHLLGPFTQWGSAYCTLSLNDMAHIWA